MKKGVIIFLGIIAFIIISGIVAFRWVNTLYTSAISLQENVEAQWGNVQTAYQRRADLVPNLVATVKGAAENEKEILTGVTQARAGIVNAKTPEDMELMGKKINTAINLAFEAYPQIRSTQNFSDLQAQLEGTENRISVERRKYNDAVRTYNKLIRHKIKRMGINMLADEDEFTKREMFTAKKEAQDAPTVAF